MKSILALIKREESLTYQYTMTRSGSKDRRPVVRAAGSRVHTGQFRHRGSRRSETQQGYDHSVDNSDTSALLHANSHGGRQSNPTVAYDKADAKDCKRPDVFLHLRLKP